MSIIDAYVDALADDVGIHDRHARRLVAEAEDHLVEATIERTAHGDDPWKPLQRASGNSGAPTWWLQFIATVSARFVSPSAPSRRRPRGTVADVDGECRLAPDRLQRSCRWARNRHRCADLGGAVRGGRRGSLRAAVVSCGLAGSSHADRFTVNVRRGNGLAPVNGQVSDQWVASLGTPVGPRSRQPPSLRTPARRATARGRFRW